MTWQLVNPLNGEPYYDKETGEELKFTGKAKMVEYIKEHDEFRAEYEKAVSTYINHSKRDISLINEDELKAILEAEKGVEESINNTKEEEDVDTSSKEEKDEVE
jgi:hypothetical protein